MERNTYYTLEKEHPPVARQNWCSQWATSVSADTLLLLCYDPAMQQASSKKAEWRPGVYIRAYGHVRSFDRKQSIQAFSIRTIHDHNEVSALWGFV